MEKQKEYLKLLVRRENKEVLGKNWVNMWLLAIVLTATFVSIAFSNGSLKYLEMKMNDPFTNWVSISKSYDSSDFNGLRRALEDEEIQAHYLFSDVQSDNYGAYSFIGINDRIHYLQGRFFNNINTNLVRAILDKNNVIGKAISFDKLSDESFGFIITGDVLNKLGYTEDNIPGYIDYVRYSEGADTLGVEMIAGDKAAVPLPLLGVVKRLPGNMDIVSSRFFLAHDDDNHYNPLNMNNLEYQKSLFYFVPEKVSQEEFEKIVEKAVPDSLRGKYWVLEDYKSHLTTWKDGKHIWVHFDDINLLPVEVVQSTARKIKDLGKEKEIKRLFNYRIVDFPLSTSQFISVNFNSLDSIRAFEEYANDNYHVKIEMSQVNAKENFNDVSVMANILSWAMISFSLVCIILFVINMLQSYFQKVKRNLGTFKAFGIGTKELIKTYVFIVLIIVIAAVGISLLVTWLLQIFLSLSHVEKEEGFSYLSLNSLKTLWAVIIVIGAAIITVYVVMKRLLQRTPGDLIYDRD